MLTTRISNLRTYYERTLVNMCINKSLLQALESSRVSLLVIHPNNEAVAELVLSSVEIIANTYMDSQKLDAILCGLWLSFCPKMASKAISKHLSFKKFPEGPCPQTPLVMHKSDTHVTPLLKILAMGLSRV